MRYSIKCIIAYGITLNAYILFVKRAFMYTERERERDTAVDLRVSKHYIIRRAIK
jgi:hypothetical protein